MILRIVSEPTLDVAVEFKVNDMWIGVFWKFEEGYWDMWIVAIPMLPLHISWMSKRHRYYLEGLHYEGE